MKRGELYYFAVPHGLIIRSTTFIPLFLISPSGMISPVLFLFLFLFSFLPSISALSKCDSALYVRFTSQSDSTLVLEAELGKAFPNLASIRDPYCYCSSPKRYAPCVSTFGFSPSSFILSYSSPSTTFKITPSNALSTSFTEFSLASTSTAWVDFTSTGRLVSSVGVTTRTLSYTVTKIVILGSSSTITRSVNLRYTRWKRCQYPTLPVGVNVTSGNPIDAPFRSSISIGCDVGVLSGIPSGTLYCLHTGFWVPYEPYTGGTAVDLMTLKCVATEPRNFMLSSDPDTLSPYSLTVQWEYPETNEAASAFEIGFNVTFPVRSSIDSYLTYLNGIQWNALTKVPSDVFSVNLLVDKNNQIEQLQGELIFRAQLVQGGHSDWTTISASTMCACDRVATAGEANPSLWNSHGLPLSMQGKQNVDERNDLVVSFQPNSLCGNVYEVSVLADDGTSIDVESFVFNTPAADNEALCSLLESRVSSSVALIQYPMYGRSLSICATMRPQPICQGCVQNYGLAATTFIEPAIPVCTTIIPSFYFIVSGKVMTATTALAPTAASVPDVLVTLTLLDAITAMPLLDEMNSTIQVSGLTDSRGRYKLKISSNLYSADRFQYRVMPYRADRDSNGTILSEHEFLSTTDANKNYFQDFTVHAQQTNDVSFADLSEVPILGSVLLDPKLVLYGSEAFQGCGIANVVVTAYSHLDKGFKSPLRRTLATGPNGKFVITSPLFTTIVLVPTMNVQTSTSPTSNHTFVPAALEVEVGQTTIILEPFVDKTMSKFSARLVGGLCEHHIGSIAPVLFMPSCGPSAHIKLPVFADQRGTTYIVPAQSLQFRLIDPKDSTSGVQVEDNNGDHLPTSYHDILLDWAASELPRELPLIPIPIGTASPSEFPILKYQYFSRTDITLASPPMCVDSLAPLNDNQYSYMLAHSHSSVKFFLSQSYGYVSVEQNDHVKVCKHVESSMAILDSVTDEGENLHQIYQEEPYYCTTGDEICEIPARYDANATITSLIYVIKTGEAEINEHNDGDGGHRVPAYSRKIQYKIAGTVYPYQSLNVVLIGTVSIPGSLALPYPPYTPLYILRRPPGGDSYALISKGSSVSTSTSMSLGTTGGSRTEMSAGVGVDVEVQVCGGAVVAEACEKTVDVSAGAGITAAASLEGSFTATKTSIESQSFSQTIQTTQNPDLVDGDGDLFLTVAGSIQLQIGTVINGKIDTDEETEVTTCTTTSKPTLAWNRDPKSTLQWISQYDINNVVIPDLILANNLLFEKYGISDHHNKAAFLSEASKADKERYFDNAAAIEGWKKLIAYNVQLKREAVEWPEFYKYITVGGEASEDSKAMVGSAKKNNGKGSANANTAAKPTTSFMTSDGNVGSVTFYGDTQSLTFELTTESESTSEFQVDLAVSAEVGAYLDASVTAVGATVELSAASTVSLGFTSGNGGGTTKTTSTTIQIFLHDGDLGDEFKVKFKKDRVFGSPVYELVGGKSRCPHEAGTVPRDRIDMGFATSAFDHLNPNDPVSTTLILTNLSPTRESFPYTLSLVEESSLYGLKMSINGQVLSSAAASALVYNLDYGVDIQVTVDIERGSNGYRFDQTQLVLAGTGAGTCSETSATISLAYDEPCNRVAFSGALSLSPTFTINQQALINSATGKPYLSITIRNPEFALTGREWMVNFGEDFLQSIQVLYRSAPAGAILSDLDWAEVSVTGLGTPIDILNTIEQTYLATGSTDLDYFSLEWDMSALFDGPYEIQARTQCRAPAGALDVSLYKYSTFIVKGVLDIIGPAVFGSPLPAVRPFLPGQPISATFDKVISCNSYYGKARVRAWINPSFIADDAINGINVPMTYVCNSATINLQFLAPIWDNLVGRLITIFIDRMFDTTGNAIESPVRWSFFVDRFDTETSSVRISGLSLAVPIATLLAQFDNKLINVKQRISREVATLVNEAIDAILKPSKPATNSLIGLQIGSVVVSSIVAAGANAVNLEVDITGFPRFPGDPVAPYSPSFFSYYLTQGLSPNPRINESQPLPSALLTNGTFYKNAAKYRILQFATGTDLSFSSLALPVRTESAIVNNSPAVKSALPPIEAVSVGSFYTDFSLSSSASSSGVSTVSIQWQVAGALALPLGVNDGSVRLRYLTGISSWVDPDDRARINPQLIELPLSDATATLIGRVEEGVRAIYILTFRFPVDVGGSSVRFQIDTFNSTALPNPQLMYSMVENGFVNGLPVPASLFSVEQVGDRLKLEFMPSLNDGLSLAGTDNGVSYSVSIAQWIRVIRVIRVY